MDISKMGALSGAIAGWCLIGAHVATAQTMPPTPLEQPLPETPAGAFGMPMEGWVKLRYSVLADGTTDNVRAVRRMPPNLSDGAVVEAIEEWTFSPATAGGEPIEWHNNETVLVFDSESVPFEPSPGFASQYVAIDEAVNAGELEDARKENERLIGPMSARLRDIGLARMQAALIHTALEDYHSAYTAILDVTDPRIAALSDDELRVALDYRFALELQLGLAVEALATFDRLQAIAPVPEGEGTAAQAAALRTALSGDSTIVVKGRLDEAPWMHTLSRRTFAIADVDGNVRSLDVECDRRTTELEFESDVEWSLPESWGACSVFVDGKRDTTFNLYEFK